MADIEVKIDGFCPVDVKEIYEAEKLETYRYLKGDYCIEIVDGDKTVYITDFCGTYSAKKLPRNTTLVVEKNKVVYKKDNVDVSPYFYHGPTRTHNLDKLFIAIDEAVKLRCDPGSTLLMSSGQDSGTIVASALRQDLDFSTLSISGLEDQEILKKRLSLIKSSRLITDWPPGTDSHLVAATNCTSDILLSGLGADELYWTGDFQLMEQFLYYSYKEYSKFQIEVRYPLLDSNVYVEYAKVLNGNLTARKKHLVEYMKANNFPHKENLKIPFYLGK